MAELTINDIIKEENLVYKKTKVMTDNVMHYCPGCGHGTTHRLVAEVIEELGIQDKTIGVTPVGCSVLMYNYLDIDMQEAAHGRAPAIATAIKRVMPDKFPQLQQRRKHHHHFRKQWYLRYDWRSDGSYHTCWHEGCYLPTRS